MFIVLINMYLYTYKYMNIFTNYIYIYITLTLLTDCTKLPGLSRCPGGSTAWSTVAVDQKRFPLRKAPEVLRGIVTIYRHALRNIFINIYISTFTVLLYANWFVYKYIYIYIFKRKPVLLSNMKRKTCTCLFINIYIYIYVCVHIRLLYVYIQCINIHSCS